MSLKEHTLFGLVDKVETSIARLKMFEPKDGYYLAFSGGKDSCVVKQLAIEAGVRFDAHYNYVGIDPPELVEFIKKHHGDVDFRFPPRRFFSALRHKKWPPVRHMRWCCELLKEGGGSGRVIVTGVRWAESAARSRRQAFESCRTDVTKKFLHPAIDWTEDDVWEFIRSRKIPYCSLYDEGYRRIGCLMCPMASVERRVADAARYPRLVAAWVRNLQWLIEHRAEHRADDPIVRFTSGAEWFDWWLHDRSGITKNEQQCFKFDSEEGE